VIQTLEAYAHRSGPILHQNTRELPQNASSDGNLDKYWRELVRQQYGLVKWEAERQSDSARSLGQLNVCESKPKRVCEGLGFKEILEHGGAGVFPTFVPTLVPNIQIKLKYK
jgi:hypothetical protein